MRSAALGCAWPLGGARTTAPPPQSVFRTRIFECLNVLYVDGIGEFENLKSLENEEFEV